MEKYKYKVISVQQCVFLLYLVNIYDRMYTYVHFCKLMYIFVHFLHFCTLMYTFQHYFTKNCSLSHYRWLAKQIKQSLTREIYAKGYLSRNDTYN